MSEPTSDHSKHVEKKTEELKKEAEEYEWIVLTKLKEFGNCVKSSIITTKNYAERAGCSAVQSTRHAAYQAAEKVQNPVVLINVLLGTGAITALLTGYAKYDIRYLRDKSDAVILTTVGTVTALLALDTVLSIKYYPKFDKKK